MKIRHVLLTTDLSEESTRPYAPVQELARELGARITLLHVVLDLQVTPHGAPFAPPLSAPNVGEEVDKAERVLAEQRERFGEGLEVDTVVVAAPDVAPAICVWATEHSADLIATSTHGRTGWRHLAFGSVAEEVLRRSEVPVLSFHRPKDA